VATPCRAASGLGAVLGVRLGAGGVCPAVVPWAPLPGGPPGTGRRARVLACLPRPAVAVSEAVAGAGNGPRGGTSRCSVGAEVARRCPAGQTPEPQGAAGMLNCWLFFFFFSPLGCAKGWSSAIEVTCCTMCLDCWSERRWPVLFAARSAPSSRRAPSRRRQWRVVCGSSRRTAAGRRCNKSNIPQLSIQAGTGARGMCTHPTHGS